MRKLIGTFALVLMALGLLVAPASAYTLNADGTGFVGKGEVQTALGLNNNQLQQQAGTLVFTFESTTVSETTWTCDKDNGPQTQERERTTTTETQGVVSSIARERNQITGFNLNGFSSSTSEVTFDGPRVGSCPSGWTAIDTVQGEPELVSSSLKVNGVAL